MDPQDGTNDDYSDGPIRLIRGGERVRARAALVEGTAHRMALARIDRERKRLDAEEERLLNRPAEPEADEAGDGPVVYFRKRYGDPKIPKGQGYQFCAVRVQTGRWWISGRPNQRHRYGPHDLTWEELLDFAYERERDTPVIWLATSWGALSPEWDETTDPI